MSVSISSRDTKQYDWTSFSSSRRCREVTEKHEILMSEIFIGKMTNVIIINVTINNIKGVICLQLVPIDLHSAPPPPQYGSQWGPSTEGELSF